MSSNKSRSCIPDIPELLDNFDDDEINSWSDADEEEDDLTNSQEVKCIFSNSVFPTAKTYFMFLKEKHNFDIWNLVHIDLKLDFFGYVKLINYLRTMFNKLPFPSLKELKESRHVWEDDKYLKPVLQDDLLLQFMIDEEDDDDNDIISCFDLSKGDVTDNENLDSEGITLLKKKLSHYENKTQCLEVELKQAYFKIEQMKTFMKDVILTNDIYRPIAACRRKQNDLEEEEFEDSGYFGTYSHHDIHAEMLQDKVRTVAYQRAILQNPATFCNKVVLDVGCGTGILSMFAVKAGAKHVFAVDMSDIAYQAMDIIKENKMDNKITIIKGCIEEIELPVKKVDIIVSEWMGYFLFYESMLDSVLFAAEKWLSDDGLLLPDECNVCLVGAHDESLLKSQLYFWNDVYGFQMSCIKKSAIKEACVQVMPAQSIISEPINVVTYDIRGTKAHQLNYNSKFSLKFTKEGKCSAVVAYFDIRFLKGLKNPTSFSTSPFSPPTHWKQTIFFLEKSISVSKGEEIPGFIECRKNPHDPRSLKVTLTFAGLKSYYTVS